MNNLRYEELFRNPVDAALYLVRALQCKVLPVHSINEDGACTCHLGARCRSPGKHPACPGGWKNGVDDPAEIEEMFAKPHRLNVGVVVGSDSGLAVVDIDRPGDSHGAECRGYETLEQFIEEHGDLPLTVTARTGGGGEHRYYRLPTDRRVPKRRLGPGLDLLSDGGYVIAPPSRHVSGEYRWEEELGPDDSALATLPLWLVEAESVYSIDALLDLAGPLPSDADFNDVREWLDRLRAIAPDVRPEDGVLFRIAAANRLAEVHSVTKEDARQLVAFLKQRNVALGGVRELEEEPQPVSPEVRAKAEMLVHHPSFLELAGATMEARGLVGEESNRLVVYLSMLSGHLEDPIHSIVKGESSAGKGELVKRPAELIPPERVIWLSSLSEKSLVYRGGRIEGVLLIEEAQGQRAAEYQLRVAMSEGRLRHSTVNKDENGRWVHEEHDVELVASVITTTTSPALHPENETRTFTLTVDDSEELTRRVKRREAERAMGEWEPLPEENLEVWWEAARLLQPIGVCIPFAGLIEESTPDKPVRMRRDFKRLLILTKAIARAHQFQRERDDKGWVVATIEDFAIARPLIQAVLGASITGLSPKAYLLHGLLVELRGEIITNWVRRAHLVKEAEQRDIATASTTVKWSKRMDEMGFWEGRLREGAWEYKPIRDPKKDPIALPTVEEVEEYLVTTGKTRITRRGTSSDAENAVPSNHGSENDQGDGDHIGAEPSGSEHQDYQAVGEPA